MSMEDGLSFENKMVTANSKIFHVPIPSDMKCKKIYKGFVYFPLFMIFREDLHRVLLIKVILSTV